MNGRQAVQRAGQSQNVSARLLSGAEKVHRTVGSTPLLRDNAARPFTADIGRFNAKIQQKLILFSLLAFNPSADGNCEF